MLVTSFRCLWKSPKWQAWRCHGKATWEMPKNERLVIWHNYGTSPFIVDYVDLPIKYGGSFHSFLLTRGIIRDNSHCICCCRLVWKPITSTSPVHWGGDLWRALMLSALGETHLRLKNVGETHKNTWVKWWHGEVTHENTWTCRMFTSSILRIWLLGGCVTWRKGAIC